VNLFTLVPGDHTTTRVALLFNPAGPPLEFFLPSVEAAASSLNVDAN